MYLLVVIGARPQFIKAAPATRALAEQTGVSEADYETILREKNLHGRQLG